MGTETEGPGARGSHGQFYATHLWLLTVFAGHLLCGLRDTVSSPFRIRTRTRKGPQNTAIGDEATIDRGRMPTGRKAQKQGDPTRQGAARWPKGRTWTLTDDSCKETKLQGPARRQGPPEAGRTDARQVRRLAKRGTCGTPGGSSQTPGLSLSNQNKQ